MPKLHDEMASLGGQLLAECVENLENVLRDARPQSNEGVTYGKQTIDVNYRKQLIHVWFSSLFGSSESETRVNENRLDEDVG